MSPTEHSCQHGIFIASQGRQACGEVSPSDVKRDNLRKLERNHQQSQPARSCTSFSLGEHHTIHSVMQGPNLYEYFPLSLPSFSPFSSIFKASSVLPISLFSLGGWQPAVGVHSWLFAQSSILNLGSGITPLVRQLPYPLYNFFPHSLHYTISLVFPW